MKTRPVTPEEKAERNEYEKARWKKRRAFQLETRRRLGLPYPLPHPHPDRAFIGRIVKKILSLDDLPEKVEVSEGDKSRSVRAQRKPGRRKKRLPKDQVRKPGAEGDN